MARIEIVNGAHVPPHAYVSVNNHGFLVDLSNVRGTLWDGPTVAKVQWGLRDTFRREFGRVTLKNGTTRSFFDKKLMEPYLAAWREKKAELGV
jgi:hypothetical protein